MNILLNNVYLGVISKQIFKHPDDSGNVCSLSKSQLWSPQLTICSHPGSHEAMATSQQPCWPPVNGADKKTTLTHWSLKRPIFCKQDLRETCYILFAPIESHSALIQVMIGCRTCDKLSAEPIMIHFTDAYMICVTGPQGVNSNTVESIAEMYVRWTFMGDGLCICSHCCVVTISLTSYGKCFNQRCNRWWISN